MDFTALLDFCETDRQREVIRALQANPSPKKAAQEIGIDVRNVQRCRDRVVRMARARGMLDDMKDLGTVPEGFYAETSVQRRLNPETGEMEVVSDWTKSRKNKTDKDAEYLAFLEGMQEFIKPAKPSKNTKTTKNTTQLATAIIIGDAHIGMLAHAIETLSEDHDLEKATADLRAAVDYVVDCAPASEEGWFVNVGDFLHADSTKAETHNGTRVDLAARHNQIMRAAGQLIRYCVSKMLQKFNTVKVINARGNHDKDAAFGMNMALEFLYEKEPRVQVFGNDSKFNYLKFGKTLVGIHHGDSINTHRLCGHMTRTQTKDFGDCEQWFFWTGHIHHETTKEHDSGIVVRSFPTLAPIDGWHSDCGYGSRRAITAITLHEDYGPVNEMAPTINMIRALAA